MAEYLIDMSGFDIVMVITIILFARLGVRLVTRYLKIKRNGKEEIDDETKN